MLTCSGPNCYHVVHCIYRYRQTHRAFSLFITLAQAAHRGETKVPGGRGGARAWIWHLHVCMSESHDMMTARRGGGWQRAQMGSCLRAHYVCTTPRRGNLWFQFGACVCVINRTPLLSSASMVKYHVSPSFGEVSRCWISCAGGTPTAMAGDSSCWWRCGPCSGRRLAWRRTASASATAGNY